LNKYLNYFTMKGKKSNCYMSRKIRIKKGNSNFA
jgi:hypothetical protein